MQDCSYDARWSIRSEAVIIALRKHICVCVRARSPKGSTLCSMAETAGNVRELSKPVKHKPSRKCRLACSRQQQLGQANVTSALQHLR